MAGFYRAPPGFASLISEPRDRRDRRQGCIKLAALVSADEGHGRNRHQDTLFLNRDILVVQLDAS
jgi:hypothetical protein